MSNQSPLRSAKPNPLAQKNKKVRNTLADKDAGYATENVKDFDRAYKTLINQKQMQGDTGMLTDNDAEQLKKYRGISDKDHIRREEIFNQQRKQRLQMDQEDQAIRELDQCTFAPDTQKTRRVNNTLASRDLYDFLNDQQRFLEYKNLKNIKGQQDKLNKEVDQVTLAPEVDSLSLQIVEMMDERKGTNTQDRLYQAGHEKQRKINLDEYERQKDKEERLYRKPIIRNDNRDPNKEYHRDKPTRAALHELHSDLQSKQEMKIQMAHHERVMLANTSFRNKESLQMVIDSFKKELRGALDVEEPEDLNQKLTQGLDFSQVATAMLELGFLQSNSSADQEELLNDMYTLLKTTKDQTVMAENLQTALLVVEGARDQSNEVKNDGQKSKHWTTAGVYDHDSSLFYIREGEYFPVSSHFRPLAVNRMKNKKARHNYKYKRAPDALTFQPQISDKTSSIANMRRQKLSAVVGGNDIVDALLYNGIKRQQTLTDKKQEIDDELSKELTLKPLTQEKRRLNKAILANREKPIATGDTNIDLYYASKVHEKRDREIEEIEFDIQKDECKFQPDLSKAISKVKPDKDTVFQVKGLDKQMARLAKAREEAAFKKKMTERSNFSATDGVKKARKDHYRGKQERPLKAVIPSKKVKSPAATIDLTPKANDKPMVSPAVVAKPSPPRNPAPEPAQQAPPVETVSPSQNEAQEAEDSEELVAQQLDEMQDRIDERDPKLYVDVNIGKNGMERIVVYEGDTAEGLAIKFCEKHNLNEDMKEKLKVLLDQQIAGVLPKILEDDDAGDESDEQDIGKNDVGA